MATRLERQIAQYERLVSQLGPKAANETKKVVAELVLGALVRNSPVDSGEFLANWQTTLNTEPTSERNVGSAYVSGLGVIRSAKTNDTILFTNLRPYAEKLDKGLFVPPNPGPSKDRRPWRRGKIFVRRGFSTSAPKGITDESVKYALRSVGLTTYIGRQ